MEEANKVAPAFSRVFKEMILVVDPKKPLPRVGKGTVAGKAALVLYDTEIDKLYVASILRLLMLIHMHLDMKLSNPTLEMILLSHLRAGT